jgi:uncharacterized Fe-S cluster-containing MiaB family protein
MKRSTCNEYCTNDAEFGDSHDHYCDIDALNLALTRERDIVNYMALKLQSLTEKSAIEEIIEAINATK